MQLAGETSSRGTRALTFLLALLCFVSLSHQQCDPSNLPVIDSNHTNAKDNATNVFKIGILGNTYGAVNNATSSSIMLFCSDRINNGLWDPSLTLKDTRIELYLAQ